MIRMIFLDDSVENYEEYFTEQFNENTPVLREERFTTPQKFLERWKEIAKKPPSKWYWVLNYDPLTKKDVNVVYGAIYPGDIDCFNEYWEKEMRKKYWVTVTRFGGVPVLASSAEEAMEIANNLRTSSISWDDDWEPTNAIEDPDLLEGGCFRK